MLTDCYALRCHSQRLQMNRLKHERLGKRVYAPQPVLLELMFDAVLRSGITDGYTTNIVHVESVVALLIDKVFGIGMGTA